MKQDDLLWKALLEDVFDDFLRFFFKDEAKIFDFERGFEFLDKELDQLFPVEAEDGNGLRFVDKLVKVFTVDGEEKWVLVHVEIQGYNDADFARRMFTYFYRIFDKYNKPVTSIAIFTDGNRNYIPARYEYNFMGVKTIFEYNVYKIIAQDADALTLNNNPFALVVLTALAAIQKGKKIEEELLLLKIDILKALVKKALPAIKVRGLMNFLKHYVRFEKPENNTKFEEALDSVSNKNSNNMGTEEYLLQKARKEGSEETKTAVVKSLLTSTDFDNQKIASLVSVTIEFVQKVKMLPENN